ncbi:MAG: hypothetical protein HN348_34410 [Proteobacteria bacterium]|nr:hypothetical protein [Pseudomonadota bacterium]
MVSPGGLKIGGVFDVHSSAGDGFGWPSVAALQEGGFVAAWSGESSLLQRFDAQGNKVGGEQLLDSQSLKPSVGAFSGGSFVAVWQKESDIFGRQFDNMGQPLTDIFSVNESTNGVQNNPSVSVIAGDNFVVSWDSPAGIRYQLFDELGSKIGGEKAASALPGTYPIVAAVQDDEFAIAWYSYPDTILLRGFSQDGPIHEEVEVNGLKAKPNLSDGMIPSVATFSDGGLIVVWPLHYGGRKAYAQRFDKDGNKLYH